MFEYFVEVPLMAQDIVLEWLQSAGALAIIISIIINILISILAIIPSVFLTAANITFFGFWHGTVISFLGESVGAIVSFYLYRMGVKTFAPNILDRYKPLRKLQNTSGWEAFYLIVAFRLFPFAPSGLVTLAGSLSSMSLVSFTLASSIGKIPALLIEATSVYYVLEWNWVGQVILIIFFIMVVGYLIKRGKRVDRS